jgi:hypothetical protein
MQLTNPNQSSNLSQDHLNGSFESGPAKKAPIINAASEAVKLALLEFNTEQST